MKTILRFILSIIKWVLYVIVYLAAFSVHPLLFIATALYLNWGILKRIKNGESPMHMIIRALVDGENNTAIKIGSKISPKIGGKIFELVKDITSLQREIDADAKKNPKRYNRYDHLGI